MLKKIFYLAIFLILIFNIVFITSKSSFGVSYLDFYSGRMRNLENESTENNTSPVLSNPKMTPVKGDIDTEFLFSVHYRDLDSNEPIYIIIMIDEAFYNLILNQGEKSFNGTYIYKTKLTEGEHTFSFMASDEFHSIQTENFTTPLIKKSEKTSRDSFIEEWGYLLLGLLLVVPLIVIYIIFIIWKPKKNLEQSDDSSETSKKRSMYIPQQGHNSDRIKKQHRKMEINYEPITEYHCYKCDSVINNTMKRCPECGEELSF
jgi:hypothetical protein